MCCALKSHVSMHEQLQVNSRRDVTSRCASGAAPPLQLAEDAVPDKLPITKQKLATNVSTAPIIPRNTVLLGPRFRQVRWGETRVSARPAPPLLIRPLECPIFAQNWHAEPAFLYQMSKCPLMSHVTSDLSSLIKRGTFVHVSSLTPGKRKQAFPRAT